MIRIAISQAAFDAIAPSLALGTVAVEQERAADGSVHLWLDPGVVAKLKALRGPGESYSDVILQLAKGDGARRDARQTNSSALQGRNTMTPILTPFLVRVRIPDLNPPDQGAMRLYIAVCETEAQAMEATKRAVPSNWQVEAVVGEAEPALIQKINPQPFHAVPIA